MARLRSRGWRRHWGGVTVHRELRECVHGVVVARIPDMLYNMIAVSVILSSAETPSPCCKNHQRVNCTNAMRKTYQVIRSQSPPANRPRKLSPQPSTPSAACSSTTSSAANLDSSHGNPWHSHPAYPSCRPVNRSSPRVLIPAQCSPS